MTGTIFGPQTAHVSTDLPDGTSKNRHGDNIDTWCQDCSSASANDGTELDAAFFNVIIGNMRHVVKQGVSIHGASFTINEGDMEALYKSILAMVEGAQVQPGTGLRLNGSKLELDVATLQTLVA